MAYNNVAGSVRMVRLVSVANVHTALDWAQCLRNTIVFSFPLRKATDHERCACVVASVVAASGAVVAVVAAVVASDPSAALSAAPSAAAVVAAVVAAWVAAAAVAAGAMYFP